MLFQDLAAKRIIRSERWYSPTVTRFFSRFKLADFWLLHWFSNLFLLSYTTCVQVHRYFIFPQKQMHSLVSLIVLQGGKTCKVLETCLWCSEDRAENSEVPRSTIAQKIIWSEPFISFKFNFRWFIVSQVKIGLRPLKCFVKHLSSINCI